MSILLKDIDDTYGPHEFSATDGIVTLDTWDGSNDNICVEMDRTEFIKAVETELNGVFISRDLFPDITERDGRIVIAGNSSSWPVGIAHRNLEGIRSDAIGNLALAEYLEANPEVNQKQVDTLTDLIREATGTSSGSLADDGAAAVARELIASGKITVKTED